MKQSSDQIAHNDGLMKGMIRRLTLSLQSPGAFYTRLFAWLLTAVIFAALSPRIVSAQEHEYQRLSSETEQLFRAGQLALALERAKEALAVAERTFHPYHLAVAQAYTDLAGVYREQGMLEKAERLFVRSLEITETAAGPNHVSVTAALNNLALLYKMKGQALEAARIYLRSLKILNKSHQNDVHSKAVVLNNIGSLLTEAGELSQAELFFHDCLQMLEGHFGKHHPTLGGVLNNLASLYSIQRRLGDAEGLYKRSVQILSNAYGSESQHVFSSLANLAQLHFEEANWSDALRYLRQSVGLVDGHNPNGRSSLPLWSGRLSSVPAGRRQFVASAFVKAAHRETRQAARRPEELVNDAFVMAQQARTTESAMAVIGMAARQSLGDPLLQRLVRERQDGDLLRKRLEDQIETLAMEMPDKRDRQAERNIWSAIQTINNRRHDIDKLLTTSAPGYIALVNPAPLHIRAVQEQLKSNEAVVLFFDTQQQQPTPEETFVWIVTKDRVRWLRSDLGTSTLTERVATLRCGLDSSRWQDEGGADCLKRTGVKAVPSPDAPLPFRADVAHELYAGLLGPAVDLIEGKDLLIVPSGPLTALPFQVLVAKPPAEIIPADAAGYGKLSWLAGRHSLTVLPSVASLMALRTHARASRAGSPFLGFGNPLLTGHDGTDRRAWDRQNCSAPGLAKHLRVAAPDIRAKFNSFFRGKVADVASIRRQTPLPETADELCAVSRLSGVGRPDDVVHLGSAATEENVKALSRDGTLANARVVHFATHALIAGETASPAGSLAEPSLMLTPPDKASDADDGLLTASEVTTLKLDADWVILSACNTAAGATLGGDAFSGLARAFFYAGARSLLVSHWYVDSDATVALVTGAFEALRRDPRIGRAEALRRSMIQLIAKGGRDAHPANWAPFVVVGEGGAGR